MTEKLLHQSLGVSASQILNDLSRLFYKPVTHDCLAFIEILQILKKTIRITLHATSQQVGAHSRPVVEQLGPVVGVGGGAEDVHHHEVLDVVMLPTGLLQLVNIIPVTNLY